MEKEILTDRHFITTQPHIIIISIICVFFFYLHKKSKLAMCICLYPCGCYVALIPSSKPSYRPSPLLLPERTDLCGASVCGYYSTMCAVVKLLSALSALLLCDSKLCLLKNLCAGHMILLKHLNYYYLAAVSIINPFRYSPCRMARQG